MLPVERIGEPKSICLSAPCGEVSLFFFFLIDFTFQSSFRFISQLSRRYTDFPYTLCPHARQANSLVLLVFENEPVL